MAHPEPQGDHNSGGLHDLLPHLVRSRKLIIRVTLVVMALTIVLNYFILPLRYTASATLLPEGRNDRMPAVGQLADIAELAGLNVSPAEVVRLYPAVATSERVLRKVIERRYSLPDSQHPENLYTHYGFEEVAPDVALDGALKELRSAIAATFDPKTNIVTLTLEATDPRLAADILNAVLEELDVYMREERVTNASERRAWVETRLKEVELLLKAAETHVQNFREKNRRIADSPSLLMQERRLLRDVEINSALFIELKKQYELARIEEIRNSPVVSVLDHARPPIKKSGPNRSGNTLIMAILAATFSGGYVVIRSLYAERISQIRALFRRSGKALDR